MSTNLPDDFYEHTDHPMHPDYEPPKYCIECHPEEISDEDIAQDWFKTYCPECSG